MVKEKEEEAEERRAGERGLGEESQENRVMRKSVRVEAGEEGPYRRRRKSTVAINFYVNLVLLALNTQHRNIPRSLLTFDKQSTVAVWHVIYWSK